MNHDPPVTDFISSVNRNLGNKYDGEYTDTNIVCTSLFRIDVAEKDGEIILQPSLEEVTQKLVNVCTTIATAALKIPRVEGKIFHALADDNLELRWGEVTDECVTKCQSLIRRVVLANTAGPKLYINSYSKYSGFFAKKGTESLMEKEVLYRLPIS